MPSVQDIAAAATDSVLVAHVANFGLAAALGYLIALVYRRTHLGFAEATFSDTLILLCALISIVMVVIGDSVARAFSLVGALSIIRFRTAVQDPRDIAFVFYSLAVGMAVGAGKPTIAIAGMGFVAGIIGVIHWWRVWRPDESVFQLSFRAPTPQNGATAYEGVLSEHIITRRLVAQRLSRLGHVKMAYRVRLRDPYRWMDLANDLSALQGVSNVRMKRQ